MLKIAFAQLRSRVKYKDRALLLRVSFFIIAALSDNSFAQVLDFPSSTGIKILPPPGSLPSQSEIEKKKEKKLSPPPPGEEKLLHRIKLFTGVNVGWIFAKPTNTSGGFESKSGPATELKTQLSLKIKKFHIESGLGMFFYSVTGGEVVSTSNRDQNTSQVTADQLVRIYSIGTLLDGGFWYENHTGFLLGGALSLRRPADLSYESSSARGGTGTHLVAQAGRRFEANTVEHRVILSIGRTLNNVGWSDIHLALGYQFGFPVKTMIERSEDKKLKK